MDDGDIDTALQGKVIALTGTLSVTRKEFVQLLEKAGATVSGSITKKTTDLVLGSGGAGTSKHVKAQKAGLKIWDEADITRVIQAGVTGSNTSPSRRRHYVVSNRRQHSEAASCARGAASSPASSGSGSRSSGQATSAGAPVGQPQPSGLDDSVYRDVARALLPLESAIKLARAVIEHRNKSSGSAPDDTETAVHTLVPYVLQEFVQLLLQPTGHTVGRPGVAAPAKHAAGPRHLGLLQAALGHPSRAAADAAMEGLVGAGMDVIGEGILSVPDELLDSLASKGLAVSHGLAALVHALEGVLCFILQGACGGRGQHRNVDGRDFNDAVVPSDLFVAISGPVSPAGTPDYMAPAILAAISRALGRSDIKSPKNLTESDWEDVVGRWLAGAPSGDYLKTAFHCTPLTSFAGLTHGTQWDESCYAEWLVELEDGAGVVHRLRFHADDGFADANTSIFGFVESGEGLWCTFSNGGDDGSPSFPTALAKARFTPYEELPPGFKTKALLKDYGSFVGENKDTPQVGHVCMALLVLLVHRDTESCAYAAPLEQRVSLMHSLLRRINDQLGDSAAAGTAAGDSGLTSKCHKLPRLPGCALGLIAEMAPAELPHKSGSGSEFNELFAKIVSGGSDDDADECDDDEYVKWPPELMGKDEEATVREKALKVVGALPRDHTDLRWEASHDDEYNEAQWGETKLPSSAHRWAAMVDQDDWW